MRICSAKLLSALSTTVALATLLPGITFTAVAQGQTGTTGTTTTTPTKPGSTGGTTPGSASTTSTPTSAKPGQGRNGSMSKEISAVLDASQRKQYNQARRSGKKPAEALQALKLTPEQQTKIDAIMAKYKNNSGTSSGTSTGTSPTGTTPSGTTPSGTTPSGTTPSGTTPK